MKLDSRIKEGKKPLDCYDSSIAEKFIGKKGYFSNSLSWYSVLKSTWNGTLNEIESQQEECFFDGESDGYFQYFLPAEWVKEPEKKYRLFSLAEWIEQHEIGEIIHYRSKSEGIVLHHMYVGYAHGIDKDIQEIGVGTLTLGVASYSLDYLFEDYEIEVNGEWKPFGVYE